jgi:hypothetical protein
MRSLLTAVLFSPVLAWAQAAFPTDFPQGAQPLTADALRQRIVGKTFVAKSATSPDVRTQYQEKFVYINVGASSDSGTWRTENSTICVEWKRFTSGCSEVRAVGDLLYVKRSNNGEVMPMSQK